MKCFIIMSSSLLYFEIKPCYWDVLLKCKFEDGKQRSAFSQYIQSITSIVYRVLLGDKSQLIKSFR